MSSLYDQDKRVIELVCRIADEYNAPDDLVWQVYSSRLDSDMAQDLIDIAKELNHD